MKVRVLGVLLLFLGGLILWATFSYLKIGWEFINTRISGKKTVQQRIEEFGASVDLRVKPIFAEKNLPYPPAELVFLVFKQERCLEVFAPDLQGKFQRACLYPVLAASGKPGPKLREGDKQVPEGVYRIESLNPNSLYHLSLKVSYPNDFDRIQAQKEGRKNLGGDIMIHGNQLSVGCVAVGDQASEDLFVLVARLGIEKVRVLLCPRDFRLSPSTPAGSDLPAWTNELYETLNLELKAFPMGAP